MVVVGEIGAGSIMVPSAPRCPSSLGAPLCPSKSELPIRIAPQLDGGVAKVQNRATADGYSSIASGAITRSLEAEAAWIADRYLTSP